MNQYLKKFIGGVIIITILFVVSYFVIRGFGGDITINDGENRKYIILFYITTIVRFGLKIKDNKLSQTIREGVLISIFLITGSFFSSSVGFGGIIGTIITIILIILIYVTKIKNTILRNVLSGIFGGIFLLMLVSNLIPIYSEAPNLEGFYATQKDEIIVPGTTIKGSIQINSGSYILTENEQRIPYIFSGTNKIIFSSQSSGITIYIKNKQGSLIELVGQSINEISRKENTTTITTNSNICKVFVAEGDNNLYTGTIMIMKDNFFGKTYRDMFIKERKSFFEKDVGGIFTFQPTVRKLSWGIISILYILDPINFGENGNNFITYGKILELDEEAAPILKKETINIRETLRERIKRSSDKTRFKFLNNF